MLGWHAQSLDSALHDVQKGFDESINRYIDIEQSTTRISFEWKNLRNKKGNTAWYLTKAFGHDLQVTTTILKES